MTKQTRPEPEDIPDLHALDAGDENADDLAGALTSPDVDLSHLETTDDEEQAESDV